jgi:hypothetical protein
VEDKREMEIKSGFRGGVLEDGSVEALIWLSLNAGFIRDTFVRKFPH